MDTTALESAYKQLLDVARGGGFDQPAQDGGRTAERLLAHVIVSDRLLAESTASLIADGQPRYTNDAANHGGLLDEVARAYGDLDHLIAEARCGGLVLVRLVRQLDDRTGATPVQTRIVDGEVTRLDTKMPWSGVVNTHAEVHLPALATELEGLQAG